MRVHVHPGVLPLSGPEGAGKNQKVLTPAWGPTVRNVASPTCLISPDSAHQCTERDKGKVNSRRDLEKPEETGKILGDTRENKAGKKEAAQVRSPKEPGARTQSSVYSDKREAGMTAQLK